MKKRSGLSEILSAIIIIAVVVAGLGLYVGLSEQRILGETITVKEAMEKKGDQHSELIELLDMIWLQSDPNILEVFLFNYGLKNITISNVIVNGTMEFDKFSESAYVRDLKENTILPDNKTIPIGKTSGLILNFTSQSSKPNAITNIVILTDSGKLIQILNETSP